MNETAWPGQAWWASSKSPPAKLPGHFMQVTNHLGHLKFHINMQAAVASILLGDVTGSSCSSGTDLV